jgi:hypothetical protein
MTRFVRCATLAVVTLAAWLAAVSPGLAAQVTVRIEGQNATLLPRTAVTTPAQPVQMSGGGTCPGNSVAGAIEQATAGNWDRKSFTQTILGETHDFSNSDYWAEWVNDKFGNGICNDLLSDGDAVLMLVDFAPPPNFTPTVFPLELTGVPPTAQRGDAFTVTATEYTTDGTPGTGNPTPGQGAIVSGGGASATVGADGTATLSMPATGTFTLRAVKSSERSAELPVCVHDGDDGTCGTASSSSPGVVVPPNVTVDRLPGSRILGIAGGARFTTRTAPRLLRGHADPGSAGLRAVRLRLRREFGLVARRPATVRRPAPAFTGRVLTRCQFYRATIERFRPGTCSASYFLYTISDRSDWSYLLPDRLQPGRYALDAVAVDRRGRQARAHVAFTVVEARR